MVVVKEDSGEVDTYVNEQEVDVEEGGATLEDKRDKKVGGGMKEVGRYNGDDADSGFEKDDVDDVDADADG